MKKTDSKEILDFLEQMAERLKETPKGSWPYFLFHFTDLVNAANILNMGFLYSRNKIEKSLEHHRDIASQSIIKSTKSWVKDCVRLYFRPKTPTQYQNEGIRPLDKIKLEAHCPVPIIFIFDSREILTSQNTFFSNGNLAARDVEIGNSAAFLKSLPFEKIYHDEVLNEQEKRQVIFHRHAEIIIPNQLNLDSLRFIRCRSEAEFQTLINLLSPKSKQKWLSKIGISHKLLFFKQWPFIEKVDLSSKSINFTFNKSNSKGPFRFRVEILEASTGIKYTLSKNPFFTEDFTLSLRKMKNASTYTIKVWLDQNLAFSEFYDEDDIPF